MDKPIAAIVAATRPRRWLLFRRPLAERRRALGELAERAAGDRQAAPALSQVWNALLREGNDALLAELAAHVGRRRLASAVDDLVASLALGRNREDDGGRNEAVIGALAAVGPAAAPRLIREVLGADATSAAWALIGLRRIGLGQVMGELAAWSRDAGPEARERLVDRLVGVSLQSWEDLTEGLAAGLAGASKERVLAEQVLARLDRSQLEKECSRLWMVQRSEAARTLLIRIFDYAQEALR
jgi:hypothetical protein